MTTSTRRRRKEKTVFTFDELSPKAKQNARQEFMDSADGYPYEEWWVYDDFIECAKCLGINIDYENYKTVGGGTGSAPKIFFSGFSSQGDGASFSGSYAAKEGGAAVAMAAHAPQDEKLRSIAQRLDALQVRCKLEFDTTLTCNIRCDSSSCSHSGTMQTEDTELDLSAVASFDDNYTDEQRDIDDKELQDIMREFADWMYHQLSEQYDYYFEDEVIDEELATREFDEEGCAI